MFLPGQVIFELLIRNKKISEGPTVDWYVQYVLSSSNIQISKWISLHQLYCSAFLCF